MKKLKDFPKALQQKLIFTVMIGAGCFVFGAAYGLIVRDRIFFFLSCAVLCFSLFRGWALYRVASQEKYEVVEGTCVRVSSKILRKQISIYIMDDEGIESSLRLGKQTKVKIGTRYRFYFKQGDREQTESDFLNSLLAGDLFLGYEMVEDEKTP